MAFSSWYLCSSSSCADSTPQPATQKSSWEGLRIFDISYPRRPEYVSAIETDCGSHTNSLAPSKDGKDVYVYVSSYSPRADYPDCQPAHDKISVVKIPADAPRRRPAPMPAACPAMVKTAGPPWTERP